MLGRLWAWQVAAALLVAPAAAQEFRRGPSILAGEPPAGAAVATVRWEEVRSGRWPDGFLPAVEKALGEAGGVLFVGHTDPVGPSALNESLGLQYAVRTAQLVHRALGGETWRLACLSAGESPAAPPGVAAYPWPPPPPASRPPTGVLILDPAPDLPRGGRLWALWEAGPELAAWWAEGRSGTGPWETVAETPQVLAPLPPRGSVLAVGTQTPGEAPRVAAVEMGPAVEDPSLGLEVNAAEAWWVRVRPRLPRGVQEARVWCGGIPYPVALREGRPVEVSVALLPGENRAYLEAIDAKGRVLVGPEVPLPEGRGEPPSVVAVVVWEGAGVDLDLHGWVGSRHTHPQDPDPAFSARAAPGTRLLFDGGADGRASALAAWHADELDLEVWCYSDLTGGGARAWLYRLDNPGDPLASRRRLFGPKQLSEAPLETRWPLPARSRATSTP